MPVTDTFVAFVLEQLDAVGPLMPKRMFGGVGLYAGDLFFALLAGDVLYLKADDSTRGALEAAGARPFQPYPDRPRGGGTMQYYSVPAAILEDRDELTAWAIRSVAIAPSTVVLKSAEENDEPRPAKAGHYRNRVEAPVVPDQRSPRFGPL